MRENLISVIIPIYNVEKYLRRCVESVRNQSYKNLEIILVEDGSPDRCSQICEELKQEDERIIVIHKENGGLSDARNFGLDIVRGEYIVFVDSDDYLDRYMIENLYDRIKKDNSELAIINFNFVNEQNMICGKTPQIKNDIWSVDRFWENMYNENSVFCVVAWNKLYKADLFKTIRFPKGKLHEDEFIIFDIINQCKKISILEKVGYFYLQRSNSITGNDSFIGRINVTEADFSRILKFYEKKMQKLAEKTLINSITHISQAYQKLDRKDVENCEKYKKIKKLYNSMYWKSFNKQTSISFKIRGFVFLVHPRIYIFACHIKRKICL